MALIVVLVLLCALLLWALCYPSCASRRAVRRADGAGIAVSKEPGSGVERHDRASEEGDSSPSLSEPKGDPSSSEDEAPLEEIDYGTLELPKGAVGEDCETLQHQAYTVSYSRSTQQPRWVAYRLDRDELVKRADRERGFTLDPSLARPTVDNEDYKGSGYDRGHMAPAADMAFSREAMRESFYFTNVAPQIPSFNRGVWSRVEEYTRTLATRYGSVWVVTGPSFHGGSIGSMGHPPIPVASHFYKAYLIWDGVGWSAAALVVPHRKKLKGYDDCWVSIDELEGLVGLDLFPGLPDGVEAMVEREVQWETW